MTILYYAIISSFQVLHGPSSSVPGEHRWCTLFHLTTADVLPNGKWWRFAGKLPVIHEIHAYKQHKICKSNKLTSNCVLHVQKVVWLHCANKKLETYHTIWHNKCHIWRILRLRLVSFTLQRPSEDPNWTASTPDRKPARPTCKDSTTSFGLTGRPSRSNQQTTVRLLYPRYMYINLLCIVCSLYIFIVYHSLDVHMSWLSFILIAYQNFSVFAPKKATAFRLKCVAWKNHRGVEHRSLVVCCNLQSHNLRGFNSRLQRAARSTGELRFFNTCSNRLWSGKMWF